MATTIKVGGQLESVAVDEKLVDAAQVKDSSRENLSQKDINDELYARSAQSESDLKAYAKTTYVDTQDSALDAKITANKSAADSSIAALQSGKVDTSDLQKSTDTDVAPSDSKVYTSQKTQDLLDAQKTALEEELQQVQDGLSTSINNKVASSQIKTAKSTSATDIYAATYVNSQLDTKQNKLTAGTNISISGSTISCTIDTTLYKVVTSLPSTPAAADVSKIFLVASTESSTQNVYKEYIWKGDAWEQLGEYKSEVDLTPYFKTENVQTSGALSLDSKVPSSGLVNTSLLALPFVYGLVQGHYASTSAIPSGSADGDYLVDKNTSGTTGSWIVSVSSGAAQGTSERKSTYVNAKYMTLDGHVYGANGTSAWTSYGQLQTSDENYTTAEKTKLAGIETGATKTTIDSALSDSSTNPVQNKVIKAQLDELASEIAALQAEKATFTCSRTSGSSIYFTNTAIDAYIQADCSITADSIVITQGGTTKNSVTNAKQCIYHETKTATAITSPTTLTYTATAKIGDVTKTASTSIYVVNPKYVGAGSTYSDVVKDACKQAASTTASGTYSVTVSADGQYVFFVVPNTMTINKVTLSGFDFPLNTADTTSKSGYKIYKSANTYKAGTLSLVVS